jgi:hypothetical protein
MPILLAGSSSPDLAAAHRNGDLECGAAGGRRQTRHADTGEGAGEHKEGRPRPTTGARWRVGERAGGREWNGWDGALMGNEALMLTNFSHPPNRD